MSPSGLGSSSLRTGPRLELGILLEDRAFQSLKRRARLQPELLPERPARSPVGLQRLGLAAGTVERPHQLPPETLSQGVAIDERLELWDELGMPTEREVGFDPVLPRGQAKLFEPSDLRLRERLVGKVRERRPTPEPERLPELLCGHLRLGTARRADQLFELREIEVGMVDVQHVSRRTRDENAVAELLPQRRDVNLNGLRGSRGWRLSPELVNERVGRDDLVGPQQQAGEKDALLDASKRKGAAVLDDLEGSENAELHRLRRG